MERKKEVEGVLPSNWVDKNLVYWPPKVNAEKLFDKRAEPDKHRWATFQLIKIKFRSGNLCNYLYCILGKNTWQNTAFWVTLFIVVASTLANSRNARKPKKLPS